MIRQDIWRLARSDYLKLVLLLALAFYIAFIPHLNYPLPVHIDEWIHMTWSKAMLQAQDMAFNNPWSGLPMEGPPPPIPGLPSIKAPISNLQAGFHTFWGIFQSISGISWLTIIRYFPGIIFMITVMSVYIVAARRGFGWEAALITCLIPTTVGILGPAFLVPVATALLFIPLSLFIAFNFSTWLSYLVLFLFTCLLLLMHAPTAVGLVCILAPYIVFSLRSNFRHSLGITLALAIPFLAPFPWMFDLLLPVAKSLLTPVYPKEVVQLPQVIVMFGYLPVALCLLGTFRLCMKGGRTNYGLVLGLLAILLVLVGFFTFHHGVRIVYERGLMYMMLMMSVVAGAGLMWVKELRLPEGLGVRLRAPLVRQNIGKILCLVLVGLTLAIAIPARQSIPYYHMIDKQDYEAFVWVRDNVSDDYEKAILDPWKATAFVAITERKVVTRIHAYPKSSDMEAYAFLKGDCSDTSFLRENGISIVYSRSPCINPDLTEVRENIYLLRE